MKIPDLSILSCSRGAPMGRHNQMQLDPDGVTKMHLHRLPFTDGCYDCGGAYWGSPANLWRVVTDEEDEAYHEGFIRASSREKAVEILKELYEDTLEVLPTCFHLQTALDSYTSNLYDDWAAECIDDPDEQDKEGAVLTDAAVEACRKALVEFREVAGDSANLYEPSEFGSLFYLSRQGHGVGFFEHPEKDGQRLQELARKVGPVDAYSPDGQDLEV